MIICFLLYAMSMNAQRANDSTQIVQLLKNDYRTLQNWDLSRHIQNCTSNYTLIEDGDIQSLADESEYYKKNAHRKITRIDSFHIRRIRVEGNLGYAIYTLHSTIIENGATTMYHWSESSICRRINGSWKLELIHSTPVRRK